LGDLGYSDLLGMGVLGYSALLGLGAPDEWLLDLLVERPCRKHYFCLLFSQYWTWAEKRSYRPIFPKIMELDLPEV